MCLTEPQIEIVINQIKRITKNMIFMEPDFSKYGIKEYYRFKKARDYPVNDYQEIMSRTGIRILRAIKSDVKEITTFICEVC
jgi:hypothetical protein